MSEVKYFDKGIYVTQFFDALIIWLTISKYSYVISKKVVPNLSIDKEISLWTNREALSGIIYHEGEHSRWHFTLGVKLNNIWFLICENWTLRKQKLLSSSKDSLHSQCSLHTNLWKDFTNFLTALLNSLNGTAEVGAVPELITETAEIITQQSVLQELEK